MAAVIFLFVVGQTICSTFPGPPRLISLNHCIAVFFNKLHVMVVHSNSMTTLKGGIGGKQKPQNYNKIRQKMQNRVQNH